MNVLRNGGKSGAAMVSRLIMGKEAKKGLVRRAALSLAFFSPVLAYLAACFIDGNTVLFEDGLLAQFPFRVFLHDAFANGFSPQWMPYSACGISLLAEGQSGICFPATQVIYRLFTAETGWIIEIVLAQLVAFSLCALLLRHVRAGRTGALLGASVYTFCTVAFSLTGVPAMMWCYALLPGIFLWCDRFIDGQPFSFVCLTALFALILLTGHPVMMLYIAMIISAFFVGHIMKGGKTFREMGPRFPALLGSAVLAAVIASPQLLPIVHEFPFSARTAGSGMSLTALQNTVHLDPGWLPLSLFPTPPLWGDEGFLSSSIRFPLYAIFLGLIGVFSGERGARRGFFIFLTLFSILMALGPYVGLWKLVHSLPGLNHLRFPYRWLFFLPICVAYFSARGADHLMNPPGGAPAPGLGTATKFVLPAGLALETVFLFRHHAKLLQQTRIAMEYSPWLTGLLWLSAIGMVLAACLTLTKVARRTGVISGVILTVISLFATLSFNIRDPMLIRDLGKIGWKGGTPPREIQEFRTSSALSAYEVWMTKTMQRHNRYTANLTNLNGTMSTGHYFSFFPYWSANASAWCQDALKGERKKRIYLNLCSSKWLFIPDGSSSERFPFPLEYANGVRMYKNPGAMPRASVVFSHRLFRDERDLLAYLESPGFDPRQGLAILRQDAPKWGLGADANTSKTSAIPPAATIVVDRPDRVEIRLEHPPADEAFLVLNDTYYPGWSARVDGAEADVIRTNYAFRGIKLPAGARHVLFYFDPLVPDTALPLPTLFLAVLGLTTGIHRYLNDKRNRDHSQEEADNTLNPS